MGVEITVRPIAYVENSRKTVEDDDWGEVVSKIELVPHIDETCLQGIEEFSHIEIIFYFHKVEDGKIQYGARHPRNNTALPKVGIFSQRGKNRPNKLGTTIVELLEVGNRELTVRGLDAIDGTPILDIKPVMKEFLPKKDLREPAWTAEIMKNYW